MASLQVVPREDRHPMAPLLATVDLLPTEQWAATAALLVALVVPHILVAPHTLVAPHILAAHLIPVQEPHLLAPPQDRLDQQELPTTGLPQISKNYKIPSMLWRSEECKEIQDTAKHEPYTSL